MRASAVLLAAAAVSCLCAVPAASEWRRQRSARSTQLLRLGDVAVGCALLTDDEASRLLGNAERIANRRPPTRRPASSRPSSRDYCPSGVTFFDGCNSCSCGTEKLCTLKACNEDTTVDIYDPCLGISCGYHQRCQAICVGQLCQLRPLCVSDDRPSCRNCPWICVDERLNCSDDLTHQACKPSLACYRPPS